MAEIKESVLQLLNDKIKPLVDSVFYDKLIEVISHADEENFNEGVATSVVVLKTLDTGAADQINREQLHWESEEFLESLKDLDENDNYIKDILIKLELLLFPLLNYTQIPIPTSNIEQGYKLMPSELREAFISELMDAVLDDIVQYLTQHRTKDFDWFYEFDVFDEIIFRLRNPQLFKTRCDDDLDRIYIHIKITLTGKYGFSQHQIAQLLVDQFYHMGPDTIRNYLEEFLNAYPDDSDHTLKKFFEFKTELNSIFNDTDMKRFGRLFAIYCKKLQTNAPMVSTGQRTIDTPIKKIEGHGRQRHSRRQTIRKGNCYMENLITS